jgi:hypothetical protein
MPTADDFEDLSNAIMRSKLPNPLERFRASRKEHKSLGPILNDDLLNDIEGYTYLNDTLFIEKMYMTRDRGGKRIRLYYLLLANCDYISSNLQDLEEKLCEWVLSEEYTI